MHFSRYEFPLSFRVTEYNQDAIKLIVNDPNNVHFTHINTTI